jgi:glycosyltransferase involved in cell wall biosynthesis
LVLLEYMARGRPFISTANDGAKQILASCKAGWSVPISDVTALTECMIYCLQEPKLTAKASTAAKQAWETYYTQALFARKLQRSWSV